MLATYIISEMDPNHTSIVISYKAKSSAGFEHRWSTKASTALDFLWYRKIAFYMCKSSAGIKLYNFIIVLIPSFSLPCVLTTFRWGRCFVFDWGNKYGLVICPLVMERYIYLSKNSEKWSKYWIAVKKLNFFRMFLPKPTVVKFVRS